MNTYEADPPKYWHSGDVRVQQTYKYTETLLKTSTFPRAPDRHPPVHNNNAVNPLGGVAVNPSGVYDTIPNIYHRRRS